MSNVEKPKSYHGALFKNKNKINKQPDYKGKIKIENKEFRLSAWESEVNSEEALNISFISEEDFKRIIENHKSKEKGTEVNEDSTDPRLADLFKEDF